MKKDEIIVIEFFTKERTNEHVPKGGGLTVLELVEKYVGLKIGVR